MCGIAGFYGSGDEPILRKMAQSIRHRGPDDFGVWVSPSRNVGLTNTRLAILDLSPSGHQPMGSGDRYWIAFNGEIYNFSALQQECKQSGMIFKGNSDTEVILRLYEQEGVRCFEKLDGMFAIAIYDQKSGELILARDRLGKKPLYYGIFSNTLIFASEPKAIMEHPLFDRTVDQEALALFLAYQYVPTPHSIWKGLNKVLPGHYAIYKANKMTTAPYWSPDLTEREVSFEDSISILDARLRQSVQERLLVADVPVGILLSGGLDSAAIAYYATKASAQRVQTFSIGFKERSFDESHLARDIAQFLNTEHHERIVGAQDLIDEIPKIAEMLDEPIGDPSILPRYLLAKFARTKITVALGGDGSDELFGGYPTFVAEKIFRATGFLPPQMYQKALRLFAEHIPVSDSYLSFGFKARRFASGLDSDPWKMHQRWMGNFRNNTWEELLRTRPHRGTENRMWEVLEPWRKEASVLSPTNAVLWMYLRTYLMDETMVSTDRANMRASLEARSPFLDHHLVEEAFRLPYTYKVRGFTTKYILKKLMEGKLPHEVIYRRKKGFGIPLTGWLRNELSPLTEEILSVENIKTHGLLNPKTIEDLKMRHRAGQDDVSRELWTALVLGLWCDKWKPRV